MRNSFRKLIVGWGFLVLLCVSSASFAQSFDEIPDPCPMPDQLAKESPPDMATVQSDIDILKLCVERANLLKQLNELVVNTRGKPESGNLAVTGSGSRDAASNFKEDNLAPVEADLFNLPEDADDGMDDLKDVEIADDTESDSDKDATKEKQKEEKSKPMLRNIFGNVNSGIIAEIEDTDGTLVRARQGDILIDGIIVSEISMQGVRVQDQDGKSYLLEWK